MPSYALTLEYDGTAFSGWQRQPGRRTVEGALLDALHAATGELPALTAAGRTDAGAHAHGQVVGCTLARPWEPDRLRRALNAHLPGDVAVVAAQPAAPGFHARFDALTRTYRYVVATRERMPVGRQYAWVVPGPVDERAMAGAARQLVGRHDLAAFGHSPRPGGSTVRTIHAVEVRRAERLGGRSRSVPAAEARTVVVIEVTADAFLRGMMRSIVGALVAVGSGRLSEAELAAMIRDGRSRRAGVPAAAPAWGLHQWRVVYPVPPAPTEAAAPASEDR